MKFEELKFEAMGCCGGHVQAVAELSDNEKLIISEEEGGNYIVARMVGGFLKGDLLRGQTVKQIGDLLE